VFVRSLSGIHVPRERIRALDIEQRSAASDTLAQTLRGTEFLQWAAHTEERFDRIVANPPYVPLRRLAKRIGHAASSISTPEFGEVPLRANCWYAFLYAALKLLKDGGGLCFVLPAAWEYATYAVPLRWKIAQSFALVDIHRCVVPLFEGVLEGSVVLLARGFRRRGWSVHRRVHASADLLARELRRNTDAIQLRESSPRVVVPLNLASRESSLLPLQELLDIRIGGVTGDVGYFLMTEHERRTRRLPRTSVLPVVSRAHQLQWPSIDREKWEQLRDQGERVWLFCPPSGAKKHGSVRKYLRLDRESGGCNRKAFKVAGRNPWYRTPLPKKVHGFLSGMSRRGPWICLRGMPGLNATNTLYVVTFLGASDDESRAAVALALLTTVAASNMAEIQRRYPDGLVKYEPAELRRVLVPKPRVAAGAGDVYRRAIQALLNGNGLECQRLADAWIAGKPS